MSAVARLTPFWTFPCRGKVHSVFQRVSNLMLITAGEERMLALCAPGLPRLPDSICLPERVLEAMRPGMDAELTQDSLMVNGQCFALTADMEWTGFLLPHQGQPDWQALRSLTADLHSGWDRFPPGLLERARQALQNEQAQQYLGLGSGLTPSFDDACVGVMALCRAMGRPAPFHLEDVSQTTDVSARYLRLAKEGYFGEPMLNLMDALYGVGSLPERVEQLLAVGATSGSDMLYGICTFLT